MSNLAEKMPFSRMMGLKITSATREQVLAEIQVSPDLCTTGHIMHGGAIMSVADTMGAIGASLNLPDGAAGTTTIESKTNFLGAAKEGSLLSGETTPVHVGRRTSVWQTRLTREDGKMVALVTQSQMVL